MGVNAILYEAIYKKTYLQKNKILLESLVIPMRESK